MLAPFSTQVITMECQPFGACNTKNNHMVEALALARPGITLTPVVVGQLHKSNKLSDYKGNLAGGLIENAHEFLTDGRVGLI